MSTIAQPAAAPPSGPRRGGRRGGGGGGRGGKGGSVANAAAAQPDDTEEVRKLRAKHADKLALLRELFPDWTDEDLLFALQEAGGDLELSVGRISEGHAEQFSSVKPKKQTKKETGSTATPSTFQGAVPPTAGVTGGAALAARGGRGGNTGVRGGRGGATTRGARGGARGGLRGHATGRGGTSISEGKHVSDTTGTSNIAPAAGATWADAVAATSSKVNGTAKEDWGDDTEGLDLQTTAATPAVPATGVDAAAVEQSSTATAASTSAPVSEEPGKVSSALAKILPSKLIPKGSKMSWAQVARPVEPAKPAASLPQRATPTGASAPPTNAPTGPAAGRGPKLDKGGATAAPNSGPPLQEDAGHVAPAPDTSVAAALAEEAPVQSAVAAEIARSPADATPAATLPPGVNASATSAPEASSGTAPAGPTAKPSMGRTAPSQRAVQRARQEAAVVMAGNNSQYDNLGVRFGSLNFLGGEDNDTQNEEPVAIPATASVAAPLASEATPAHLSAKSEAEESYGNRYAQHASSGAAATPTHVQQQTQTTPSHQDAFAQASASPYSGDKQESFNAHQYGYQQGLSQHQQAHQAAVAQTQQSHQQLHHQPAASQPEQASHQAYQTGAGTAVSGGFGGQTNQQQQQLSSQYGDYYGGLDSQRLSSFYGNYDQQSGPNVRANEERSAGQAAAQQQQATGPSASDAQQHQHHPSSGAAAQQATPQQQQHQQQQQFPNVMPYYYPHYYLPNQFQHYGQPGAGYGQYALYGQQPQHPSKPATPASLQSPYSQNGPADLVGGSGAYGNSSAGAGQYGQSPAAGASSGLSGAASGYGDNTFARQAVPNLSNANASVNDYSKLYGNTTTPGSTHSSSIPGLGGFLGQTPSGPSNGNAGTPQLKNGSSPSSALESAYRQYDNGKTNAGQAQGQTQTQPQQTQQQQQQQQQQANPQQPGQQQQGAQQVQPQHPQQQRQHQTPNATTPQQQQQQYYQQYNAYAGHQPSAATGSYGNYPYRQYWG